MELDRFAELGPNDLVEIRLPVWKVEKRLIEGDAEGQILFEVTSENKHQTQYEIEILKRGGRIFNTEYDAPLIVHSEESLKYKEQTLRTYAGL